MRASEYKNLIAQVEAYELKSDEEKNLVIDMLRSIAESQGITGLGGDERDKRKEYARHLLGMREDRTDIRDRLVTRFGVSTRTAQRDITAALKTRQKSNMPCRDAMKKYTNEEVIEIGAGQ